MTLALPPQLEDNQSRKIKNRVMSSSLFDILKEGYDKYKNRDKYPEAKITDIFNEKYLNIDNSAKAWEVTN